MLYVCIYVCMYYVIMYMCVCGCVRGCVRASVRMYMCFCIQMFKCIHAIFHGRASVRALACMFTSNFLLLTSKFLLPCLYTDIDA